MNIRLETLLTGKSSGTMNICGVWDEDRIRQWYRDRDSDVYPLEYAIDAGLDHDDAQWVFFQLCTYEERVDIFDEYRQYFQGHDEIIDSNYYWQVMWEHCTSEEATTYRMIASITDER